MGDNANCPQMIKECPHEHIPEHLFERYLTERGLSFSYEQKTEGKIKRPDYQVLVDGGFLWCEVKELVAPAVKPTAGFSPCPPIKEKINGARRQFREFGTDCCVLVLHSCVSIYRGTGIPEVLSAAFGKYLTMEPHRGQTLVDEPLPF